MAQINNQPILSLCIPIYNRLTFLERQLGRMLEDKALFENQIQLIISDNCSSDDLKSCCDKYQQQGLNLIYHRNETNVGPDGNFDWCFHHADGKYVWLLGSDDVPVSGFVNNLVGYLKESDYGLVHLSIRKMNRELTVFENSDDMAVSVNYWLTFMSSNIIRTDSLKTIDLSDYRESYMIQVPAYLNACCSYQKNAILYIKQFFELDSDAANNGGYNLFQVFVTNLFGIFESFVDKGMLTKKSFDKMIEVEYKEFLSGYIINQLILHQKQNFTTNGAWSKLWKYYGRKPYAYYYLMYALIKKVLWHILFIFRPVLKPVRDKVLRKTQQK